MSENYKMKKIPNSKDKMLFTPGPLTTSLTVKQAMLRDLGSRDIEFINIVKEMRQMLLNVAEAGDSYTAIPLQGSGSYALEAVVTSCIENGRKLLAVINGSYGKRLAQMAERVGIETVELTSPENELPDTEAIRRVLESDDTISMVSMCSCETTSGIYNPVKEVGQIAKEFGCDYFVDAMSNFGAFSLPVEELGITYLVSSANKCIEGVPGFSFVIAEKEALAKTENWARSISFDLYAQYQGLEKNGQFRFTPPTHSILAFHTALKELELEGGVEGRAARYKENFETLMLGMRRLGFQEYLRPELQGYIISSFIYPKDKNWDFEKFYSLLNEKSLVIYPGKVGDADCFRIGNIGRLYPYDIQTLVYAIEAVLKDMNLNLGE